MAIIGIATGPWGHVAAKAPTRSQATGLAALLLAEGRLVVVDVASGVERAGYVTSAAARYALPQGRVARSQAADEVFAVLPDGTAAVLAALNTRTFAGRIVARLPADFYPGLAVGQQTGRVYAFGSLNATVSAIDPATGSIVSRLSQANGNDVYSGAISADERTIYVSYHGNASGIDVFDAGAYGRGAQTRVSSHGNFALFGDAILAAIGDPSVIEVDSRGRIRRTLPVDLPGNHFMEFAVDPDRSLIYAIGSCMYAGGLSVIPLKGNGGTRVLVASRPGAAGGGAAMHPVCGERISVAPGGDWLVIAPLRHTVRPDAGRPGSVLIVEARTGEVWREIATTSEVVDVLALR